MGKRSTITELPREVRAELNSKLAQSNCSGFRDLEEWLLSLGYTVSKSAIHRYATQRPKGSMVERINADDLPTIEIRIRCLEVAARMNGTSDFDKITALADDLLMWASRG